MSRLKRIIHNCKQATYLLDKKEFTRLGFRETIELRIHLAYCSWCRLYGKQTAMINNMVQQLFKDAMKPEVKLDDAFKRELQRRIEDELEKNN